MNRVLIAGLVFVWVFASTVVFAQGEDVPPPPPPAPKEMRVDRITSIVSTSAKFHSEAGGFKIAFPGKPKTETSAISGAFGPTQFTIYTLDTTFASYSIAHVDFPVAIKDKLDLNIRFDAMRDGEVKRMNGRVTTDSEFYFGTNYGRNVVVENDTTSATARWLVVEQRMFLMTVYTKGSLTRQSTALRNANLKRVNDFLNSFEVTTIPKPELEVVELPDDFGVTIRENKFTSSFLRISVDLPSGWHILEEEEKEMLTELGRESVSEKRPAYAEYLDPDRMRLLVSASNKPLSSELNTAMFMIVAEKAPFPTFLPISVARTYVKTFLDKTDVVVKPPSEIKIGEFDLAWIEIKDSQTKVSQRMYWSNVDGIALEFVLTYNDKAELDTMLRTLNSLKRVATAAK